MDVRSFQREDDGSWVTGFRLEGAEEPARFILRSHEGRATKAHLTAAIDVANRWPEFQQALAPALFAFYRRTAARSTESGPKIAAAEEVWSFVTLHEIEAISNPGGRVEYVHACGRSSWEEEHGLEIVMRGTCELLYVGGYEGWSVGQVTDESDWNFASPAVQKAALAEEPITDDELEECALGQPIAQEAPAPKPFKPWWRFW